MPDGKVLTVFAVCVLLLFSGCSLKQPALPPLLPEEIPQSIRRPAPLPPQFKGIASAVLTTKDGPRRFTIAYAVAMPDQLRLSVLTPFGSPVADLVTTPDATFFRDAAKGTIQSGYNFQNITDHLLGTPIGPDALIRLLAGRLPLPSWTKAYPSGTEKKDLLLYQGRKPKARILLGPDSRPEKIICLHPSGTKQFQVTKTHSENPVMVLHTDSIHLSLRIRKIRPVSEIPPETFVLTPTG